MDREQKLNEDGFVVNQTSYSMFDPTYYVQRVICKPGEANNETSNFLLKCLSKYFTTNLSSVQNNSLKILEYGCGPNLANVISAIPKAAKITLAEYAEVNREFILKWLSKDPLAFDWSPYFKYVVKTLEGRSEEEAIRRQEELRSKVEAVVSCDLTKDQFIAEGYDKQYDIIMSFFCLECCGDTLKDYEQSVRRIASIITTGGHLLLYSTQREMSNEGYYIVGGKKFNNIPLKKDFVVSTLKESNFGDIVINEIKASNSAVSNSEAYMFISCRKL